jgi:hypothetical protein
MMVSSGAALMSQNRGNESEGKLVMEVEGKKLEGGERQQIFRQADRLRKEGDFGGAEKA